MPTSADVVIVGGGLAGLSAAITCLQASPNLTCLLLEAQDRVGGNSAKASSGINSLAPELGDVEQDFEADTLACGAPLSDPELVHTLVHDSKEALAFLERVGSINLTKVTQLGGHSHARTHRNTVGPNVGFAIMKPLIDTVTADARVAVMTGCRVTGIARAREGWQHVQYEHTATGATATCGCSAVVLAAGGFAGSAAAVQENAPRLGHLPSTNTEAEWQGGILKVAKAAGAQLLQLDQVQVHPTAFVDPAHPEAHSKILAPEALRGHGAVLIDRGGRRFVNELTTRDRVVAAMTQAGAPVWMLLPSAAADAFGAPAIAFYVGKRLFTACGDVDAAAAAMAVPVETLRESLAAYNAAAAGDGADAFGKTAFPARVEEPLFVARVTPALHYCMGGIKVDSGAKVIGEGGEPLPGLFAAGEVTGGLHGKNRLAGNSLLDCVVFGRRAGASAAAFCESRQPVQQAPGEQSV